MSEEEIEAVEWLKKVINYYKKDIEDYGETLIKKEKVEFYETIFNLMKKQTEKERNLKKELMEQDELIEKLSRKLNEKIKEKYI